MFQNGTRGPDEIVLGSNYMRDLNLLSLKITFVQRLDVSVSDFDCVFLMACNSVFNPISCMVP